MVKRVAVIGAGVSGLAAIKCCREEGFEAVCFERSDHIAGLWHYTPSVDDGQASIMKTTITNTSKDMMCFTDFPMPDDFPRFLHNTKVLEYYNMYADHFNLRETIRFKTEVLKLMKATDFDQTGRWKLHLKDLDTSKVTTETYDAVMVCTGHHASKYVPHFPGMEDFQGKIVHSQDYKENSGYKDMRAVVVGFGNSAMDAATDLAKVSKQVYLSTRRGGWCIGRVSPRDIPMDVELNIRVLSWLRTAMPAWVLKSIMTRKLKHQFKSRAYGLQPKQSILSAQISISDELPSCITNGSIIMKPNIAKFTKQGVEFDDGSSAEVDVVILATGYDVGFPFIDEDILDVKENVFGSYKYVFPPDMEHPTLAIIGYIQTQGSIIPMAEMQSRWTARIWKGYATLPPKDEMWIDIHERRKNLIAHRGQSRRFTIEVQFISYLDELADEIGCKPSLKMFLEDPVLAWVCFVGPCTPLQYRLTGPHSWTGAREAVLAATDRLRVAQRPSRVGDVPTTSNNTVYLLLQCMVVVVMAYLCVRLFL